jgi:hypothetical protein
LQSFILGSVTALTGSVDDQDYFISIATEIDRFAIDTNGGKIVN